MRWTNKTSQNPSSLKRTSSSIAKPSNARLVWIKTCQNHQSSCPTSSTISSKCPRKRDLSVQASALKIKEVIFRRSTTEKLFETWNGDVIWNRLKGSVYFKGTPSERQYLLTEVQKEVKYTRVDLSSRTRHRVGLKSICKGQKWPDNDYTAR